MNNNTFGDNLKKILKEKGISQKRLAEHLNVVGKTISRFATNERMPKSEIICRIAEYLNISTDELLGTNIEPKLKNMTELERLKEQIKNIMFDINFKNSQGISLCDKYELQGAYMLLQNLLLNIEKKERTYNE